MIQFSLARNDEHAHPEYAFDVVKTKLLDSLDAFECGTNVGNKILGYNESGPKRPLHLSALADGPRLRLLWATFQKIEEEVRHSSVCSQLLVGWNVFLFSFSVLNCFTWLNEQHKKKLLKLANVN